MYISDSVLQSHVRESNKIEGESWNPEDPSFVRHLEVARMVADNRGSSRFLHPNDIHLALFHGTELGPFAGSERTIDVYYGTHQMPDPAHVPELMVWWWQVAQQYFHQSNQSGKEAAFEAERLAHTFLCIHPYQDGNGRTARLLHNMLRIQKGLPWLVVKDKRRLKYFERIRAQELFFISMFPYAYSSPASY